MVFKGTRRRRMHHIAARMESVGGYLNAFTSKEYTCFVARALDEHLERAIDVTCDLVLSPVFPASEVEKEKDVIVEEIRMYEDVPEDLIFDRLERMLYPDHQLGNPVVGYARTVRALTRESLVAYQSTRYVPGRIVVAVAGAVEHARVVDLVNRAFAQAEPAPSAGHSRERRQPLSEYRASHSTEPRSVQQAHLLLGRRSLGLDDPRRTALAVLNTIVGGGMSSRLNQNIREKYGYCYHVYSFSNMLSDTGEFGVYMATDSAKVERAKSLVFAELRKLADSTVSPRRLRECKSQLKGSLLLALESLSNRMSRLGRLEIHNRPYRTLDDIVADVDEVTAEEVQAVARELFEPQSFSSVVFYPQAGSPASIALN
jgi:predicted Zn-dependent peptidase